MYASATKHNPNPSQIMQPILQTAQIDKLRAMYILAALLIRTCEYAVFYHMSQPYVPT